MLLKIVKTYKPFFLNDNSMQMMILVILFKEVEKQPSQAYWQPQNVFKTQSFDHLNENLHGKNASYNLLLLASY